jgi:hypothetical protein
LIIGKKLTEQAQAGCNSQPFQFKDNGLLLDPLDLRDEGWGDHFIEKAQALAPAVKEQTSST